MQIHPILRQLESTSSTNSKLAILKEHKDNKELQTILSLAYDTITYSYGIRDIPTQNGTDPFLELECDRLQFIFTCLSQRKYTGNAAREFINALISQLNSADATLVKRILDRDLKIGIGVTQINKVWPGLIPKPPYMRCSILNEKTLKKMTWPAILQVKADGMFQQAIVECGTVKFLSRSGEERSFPILESILKSCPSGVYIGELIIPGLPRQQSNGLINSDNPPHDQIQYVIWDRISLSDYNSPKNFGTEPYKFRFDSLSSLANIAENVTIIESRQVKNIDEAMQYVSTWMKAGFEGGVLKSYDNLFKDHTSPTQLKIKLEIEVDVRVTGFTPGTPGTKREKTFGAITFQTDDGKIQGQTSGFTDEQLEDYNSRRNELIGKIMTVQCNDLIKSEINAYYALSHPRFIEFRSDKDTTDTLERVEEMRELKMTFNN